MPKPKSTDAQDLWELWIINWRFWENLWEIIILSCLWQISERRVHNFWNKLSIRYSWSLYGAKRCRVQESFLKRIRKIMWNNFITFRTSKNSWDHRNRVFIQPKTHLWVAIWMAVYISLWRVYILIIDNINYWLLLLIWKLI